MPVSVCSGQNCITPKTWSPNPLVLVNVTLLGNRLFADVIKSRQGHSGLGWALNPVTGVLIRRCRFEPRCGGRTRWRHTGRTAHGWGDAPASQGMLAHWPQCRKRQKWTLPWSLQRECGPADTSFWRSGLNCKRIPVVLKSPINGNLLCQP